jgi:SAM-dependent methyltransferase
LHTPAQRSGCPVAVPLALQSASIHVVDFKSLQSAAGSLEAVEHRPGELFLSGWMLLPDEGAFDRIELLWNGENTGTVSQEWRPDVENALPWVEDAARAGFSARLPAAENSSGRVDLIGYRRGSPRARTSSIVRPTSMESAPLPPRDLIDRAAGRPEAAFFRTQGLKGFTDLLDAIEVYAEDLGNARLLDWGCGCGRFTRFFVDAGFGEVYGCDIDIEAIEWCQRHLAPARFCLSSPEPPLPYRDASMDLALACSVFTHLSRTDQDRWLAELHRVLVPGGLLLASVNAPPFVLPFLRERSAGIHRAIRSRLRAWRRGVSLSGDGIVDTDVDQRLDGIAPEGYYRATYQTSDYTMREWSRRFDILEYAERGLTGHQDLVVMRRPAE